MRLLVSLAISLAIAGSGCNFAVKHPAATAGIVVGAIGLATCSLTTSFTRTGDESLIETPRMKCYGVTALAGLAITGIASLALWLGYEDDVTPAPGGTSGPVHDPTNLEPAPVFVPKTPPAKPEPAKPEPAKPEPAKPEPTPDPDKPEPPKPEPTPTPPADPAPTP